MSTPLLASLGLRLEAEDLYSELLAIMKEKPIGRDVVTNQFVLEIREKVGLQGPGGSNKSSGKITVKQACHILAFLADRVRFPIDDIGSELKFGMGFTIGIF